MAGMFEEIAAIVRRQAAEKFDPTLIQPRRADLTAPPAQASGKCCGGSGGGGGGAGSS